MNNKLRIFLKVIYYISTFTLGLFLALYLPNVLYYNETMKQITTSLTNEDYPKSMIYIGGYFNDNHVYSQRFDENSGIVLFESVTLSNNPNKTEQVRSILKDSYSGFIYNIKGKYNATRKSDNKSILTVVDKDNKEVNFSILDKDTDSDGYKDSINTLDDAGFIFLDLTKDKVSSIKTIKLFDREGNLFKEFDLSGLNLNYNSSFFTDVHKFTDAYNLNNFDTALVEIDKKLRDEHSNYIYSSYSSGNVNVTTKAIFIILAYFIVIYLIGDSLLGKRYVYRGVKYLIIKIFKINPKPKKEKNSTYTSDYYSELTLSLDLTGLTEEAKNEFPEEVEIKYNSESDIIVFKLTKETDYKQTERVKAGIYTNMQSSLKDTSYYLSGVVSNLKISGFKNNVLMIVRKRGD